MLWNWTTMTTTTMGRWLRYNRQLSQDSSCKLQRSWLRWYAVSKPAGVNDRRREGDMAVNSTQRIDALAAAIDGAMRWLQLRQICAALCGSVSLDWAPDRQHEIFRSDVWLAAAWGSRGGSAIITSPGTRASGGPLAGLPIVMVHLVALADPDR